MYLSRGDNHTHKHARTVNPMHELPHAKRHALDAGLRWRVMVLDAVEELREAPVDVRLDGKERSWRDMREVHSCQVCTAEMRITYKKGVQGAQLVLTGHLASLFRQQSSALEMRATRARMHAHSGAPLRNSARGAV